MAGNLQFSSDSARILYSQAKFHSTRVGKCGEVVEFRSQYYIRIQTQQHEEKFFYRQKFKEEVSYYKDITPNKLILQCWGGFAVLKLVFRCHHSLLSKYVKWKLGFGGRIYENNCFNASTLRFKLRTSHQISKILYWSGFAVVEQ